MATVTANRPLRVLIVEDNHDAAVAFQAVFNVQGHNAVVANDGAQAIEMARQLPLDVIVCDLNLPDMDGFSVVKTLRSDPTIPYHPVCALTARSDEESRRRAAAVGFDGYIVKPPRYPQLLQFLKRYQR